MGRKLEQVGAAVGFAKGVWAAGKTTLSVGQAALRTGQAIAPWVARAAAIL